MNRTINRRLVDMADFKVSGNNEDILITNALSSCAAVAVYDPQVHVGGLLHFVLPYSSLDENKARYAPAMFADTGIPLLLQSCYALGANKKRMTVRIAGGSTVMKNGTSVEIGKKNIAALKEILWKYDFLIEGEDTGNNCIRFVQLLISNGGVTVRSSNRTRIMKL